MPLALHRDVGGHRNRAERIDVDRHHRYGAVLRTGFLPRVGGEQSRQIAHVRHARLDDGGKADAIMPAGRPRRFAPLLQFFEPPATDSGFDGLQIIARIVERAGRGLVWELGRRNEIALDDVQMVEIELDRDALHQPLDGQIELRSAETADQARRHLVGENDAIGHVDIGNIISAGDRAVHAIERPRHRRAQESAVILELIELERENPAVLGDGRLDLGDAVRPGTRRDKVLDPVLDPFHRPARDACGERHEHHVGKYGEFDAETAAAVGRNAHAKLRAGHAQRARHHRDAC